jgi:hypothetical protein
MNRPKAIAGVRDGRNPDWNDHYLPHVNRRPILENTLAEQGNERQDGHRQ